MTDRPSIQDEDPIPYDTGSAEFAKVRKSLAALFLPWNTIPRLIATVDRLEAERRPELQPGRWFRILAPDGSLWMETSDEEEARAESLRTGWSLERQWFALIEEWRKES